MWWRQHSTPDGGVYTGRPAVREKMREIIGARTQWSVVDEKTRESISRQLLESIQWLVQWGHSGCNVLELRSDFVAAMILTDHSTLDAEHLRLPWPAFMMTVPTGFVVGTEGHSYTRALVWERSVGPAGSKTQMVPVESVTSNEAGLSIYFMCENTRTSFETTITWHELIDQGLNKSLSKLPENSELVMDQTDLIARKTANHLVFGTVAYIHANSAALTAASSISASSRQARKSHAKLWSVGRTVQIAPELVRSVRLGVRDVQFRLKHRHIVRGHYRQQPCGPERQDRKEIWIAPYWKGPAEGAEIVQRTYRAGQGST